MSGELISGGICGGKMIEPCLFYLIIFGKKELHHKLEGDYPASGGCDEYEDR